MCGCDGSCKCPCRRVAAQRSEAVACRVGQNGFNVNSQPPHSFGQETLWNLIGSWRSAQYGKWLAIADPPAARRALLRDRDPRVGFKLIDCEEEDRSESVPPQH
jgi:hypothetical protein